MTKSKQIVVIGGSAAGPKAAARARRLDQHADITIIQKDPDLSMASCGYPYYVGAFFEDRNLLISAGPGTVRNAAYYKQTKAIKAVVNTEVTGIDRIQKQITCRNLASGEIEVLPYDRLIIATGSVAKIPTVPGKSLDGIRTLKTMEDVDYLKAVCVEKKVKQAAIIGGGLIGVEVCEALAKMGIEVTIVEFLPQILAFLDWQLAKLVENYIASQGVRIITGNGLSAFLGDEGALRAVKLSDGTEIPCALAVAAVGVGPNVDLARQAGLDIGVHGGIIVDPYMQTSDPDIYAVGDCTEQYHLLTCKPTIAPLGDLANLEGRVAGENAVLGNEVTFPGTVQSGICKVFEYAAGSTGLSETAARASHFGEITTVVIAGLDKPGFMNGQMMVSKMVVETQSQRIIGFQCIGAGDVAKQVTQAAIAIQAKMTVGELVNLDLPYAPPFSPAIDNFIACAHVIENKLKGRLIGLPAEEVKARIDRGEKPYLLDVRSPEEFAGMRIGIGETLVPLGTLRARLSELPQDKQTEIIAYCKVSLRAYEAALILAAHGWTNVKVMEGGVTAWPYTREK